MTLRFEKVISTSRQINDLYLLLKTRTHSISHFVLPTKKEHSKFVLGNPYIAWYLVYQNKELFGSFYLQSDNSIGLNFNRPNQKFISQVFTFIQEKHKPLPPIKSVRRKEFFVNVSSDNLNLIKILKNLDKSEIQRSFII